MVYGKARILALGVAGTVLVGPVAARAQVDSGVAAAPTQAAPDSAATLLPGDPRAGKELFMGARRFANGAPPCMACHSVAGIGALGGGALGPDLTPAFTKYTGPGLAAILASPPFPTMQPIFGSKPLTPNEQADLVAYLAEATATARPARAARRLAGLAGAGAALLFALAAVTWRRRLVAVRDPMIRRATRAASTGARGA